MADVDPFFFYLHEIPQAISEETLEQLLQTLWRTRRTGIGSGDRPRIQSLLALPTLEHLDPVLACLRLLIRKCVDESLTGGDLQELFPSELSVGIRSPLLLLLRKYQQQWKEEASRDQPLWQSRRARQRENALPLLLPAALSSELLPPLWLRQHEAKGYANNGNLGGSVTGFADPGGSEACPARLHQQHGSSNDVESVPRLKSMTWTMENRNLSLAGRVAVITLKLQDHMRSPLGETEVKFQLSKDTLEALLRSMTFINEKLSNAQVMLASEPLSKKQRQQ